jgi:hypothetical protein
LTILDWEAQEKFCRITVHAKPACRQRQGAKIEFAKTAKMGLLNFWNVDLYETLCLGDFVAFGILMKLNR